MILKNVLKDNDYYNLSQLLSGVDFPWYYQPDIAFTNFDDHTNDPNVFSSYGFTHVAWDCDHGKVSDVIHLISPIAESFEETTRIKINNFLRIKINLQTPLIDYTYDNYNGAHIDRFEPHKTIIYYVNDSDGDTVIFNNIYDPNDKTTWHLNTDLKIKEKITPVANSLYYLENGLTYHSGSNPIKSQRRITININFN
jgi:hypothetical protein